MRRPVASPMPSLLVKVEEAVAAVTTKAVALDVAVAATRAVDVAVAATRAVVVTKDVVDADSMAKVVGAKVHITKETKVPTTRAIKVMGAGPITHPIPLWYSLKLRTLRAFTMCPCLIP